MSEQRPRGELSKQMLRHVRVPLFVVLAGVVFAATNDNNEAPVKPIAKEKLVCPPTPQELAKGRTLEQRVSPLVRFVIRNTGGKLDASQQGNTVLATMVSRDESAPPDMPSPEIETAIISDFGQHQFSDPTGKQYLVDIAQPPAETLATDPQAADVLICR